MPAHRRTIPASEFKARCLELMDSVRDSRTEWLITKHGTPVARLVPVAEDAPGPVGFLRGTVRADDGLLRNKSGHIAGRRNKSE